MASCVVQTSSMPKLLESGIAFHNAARHGEVGAVEKAIGCFEQLENVIPKNVHVLSFLGSSNALKARYSKSVTEKRHYASLGLSKLDYAVELAPYNFVARVIRWNVGKELPELYGRRNVVAEDLRKLDAIFEESLAPDMAIEMVPAYASLIELEPSEAKWTEMKAKAENLSHLACDRRLSNYLAQLILKQESNDPIVAKAMEMMLDDVAMVPSLDKLADTLSMSPVQLIRVFKKYTGLTPMAWLRNEKLYLVRDELAKGEKVLYLAAKYGFSDHPHLSRLFKAMFGYTPIDYKRAVK